MNSTPGAIGQIFIHREKKPKCQPMILSSE